MELSLFTVASVLNLPQGTRLPTENRAEHRARLAATISPLMFTTAVQKVEQEQYESDLSEYMYAARNLGRLIGIYAEPAEGDREYAERLIRFAEKVAANGDARAKNFLSAYTLPTIPTHMMVN